MIKEENFNFIKIMRGIFILMLLSVIYTFISGLHYYIINFKNLVNE